jgi:hypothetical protein
MSFETPLPPFNASDPAATFVSASCLELMMIELVPMAYRVANEVEAASAAAGHKEKENGAGTGAGEKEKETRMDEDEERDAVFYRLEALGYRVGQGLVERYVA